MKVLLICDDKFHPGEVLKEGLSGMEQQGFRFDFMMEAKEMLTPELLWEYPVVIVARGNPPMDDGRPSWFEPGVSRTMPEDFRRYVEEGGGLLALHGGNAFRIYRDREFCRLVGNSFVQHPPCCEVRAEIVGAHEITEGVEPFAEWDEHYELDHLAADREVFLETISENGGRQPAGYTRLLGKGRICVLTPGHTLPMLKNPHFRRLLSNALNWCAGGQK